MIPQTPRAVESPQSTSSGICLSTPISNIQKRPGYISKFNHVRTKTHESIGPKVSDEEKNRFQEEYMQLRREAGHVEDDLYEDEWFCGELTLASYKKLMGSWGSERLDASRLWLYGQVASRRFDIGVAIMILMNTLCMGVELSMKLERGVDQIELFNIVEHVFLVAYMVELFLRAFAMGSYCLDKWTSFDAVVVIFSVVGLLIPELGFVQIFRLARWLRFARALRALVMVRELWMLIEGLVVSGGMMFYTAILLLVLLYAFALIGIEIITIPHKKIENPDPDINEIVNEYFGSVPLAMLTLLQFTMMDSCASIYRPLIKYNWWFALYFVSVIMVGVIALMNIVTAVLVNSAIEHAERNRQAAKVKKDRHKKKLMVKLKEMFVRLDKDDSERIDIQEILHASDHDRKLLVDFMEDVDVISIFHELDIDKSGCLNIDEFCEGLYQHITTNIPVELRRVDKNLMCVREYVEAVYDNESKVLQHLKACLQECLAIKCQIGAIEGEGLSSAQVGKADVIDDSPPVRDVPHWVQELFSQICTLGEIAAGEAKGLGAASTPMANVQDKFVLRDSGRARPRPRSLGTATLSDSKANRKGDTPIWASELILQLRKISDTSIEQHPERYNLYTWDPGDWRNGDSDNAHSRPS